jgi:hypothetical protein
LQIIAVDIRHGEINEHWGSEIWNVEHHDMDGEMMGATTKLDVPVH